MYHQKSSKVVIKSDEERLVYGEVYSPLQVDTDGEAMTSVEIKRMAHRFLMKGLTGSIDVKHNFEESGCLVVESFLARKDDPDGFIDGSWVLGVKVLPDDLWESVKKGEINGFSFSGTAKSKSSTVVVAITRKMIGTTEKSDYGPLPDHDHEIEIVFNDNSKIIEGVAKENMGHKHPVLHATATEIVMDHAHRLVLIENDSCE